MKIFRVIQLLALGALIGYLVVLHNVNPQIVILPFLISLPVSWVVGASLLFGFVVGWLAFSGHAWRLARENRALRQRLSKAGAILEPDLAERDTPRRTQVRRAPTSQVERGGRDEEPLPPEDLSGTAEPRAQRRSWRFGSGRNAHPDADEEL